MIPSIKMTNATNSAKIPLHVNLDNNMVITAMTIVASAVITMLLSKLTCKGIFALLVALVIFILGIIPDVMEVVLYNSIFLVDSGERYFLPRPEFY